jgi:hypothetical protein
MKPTLTLTQIQQAAIDELLAIRPVTKRGSGALQARQRHGIRLRYVSAAIKLGFTHEQGEAQWQDVLDMRNLERDAE